MADRVYPLLKGASHFCLDGVRENEKGHLVTPVSFSPENRFHTKNGQVAAASTADVAMIRELFVHTIHAARVLDRDPQLRETLATALDKLPPYRIGRFGQLPRSTGGCAPGRTARQRIHAEKS